MVKKESITLDVHTESDGAAVLMTMLFNTRRFDSAGFLSYLLHRTV